MKSRRVIDVRKESGPSELAFRLFAPNILGSNIRPLAPYVYRSRGPVRLVVEMPAPPLRKLVAPPIMAVLMYGVAISCLAVVGDSLAVRPLLLAAALAVGCGLLVAVSLGWPSRSEVLEIDSRFITVRRGMTRLACLPRASVTRVVLALAPHSGRGARLRWVLAGRPRLFLTSDDRVGIKAGRGISRSAADELLPVIAHFLADTPPEGGTNGRVDRGPLARYAFVDDA